MKLPATTKDISVEWLNEALHENGVLGNSNIVSVKHEPGWLADKVSQPGVDFVGIGPC